MNGKEMLTALKCTAGLAGSVLFLCSIGLHYSSPGSWTGFLLCLFFFLTSLFSESYEALKKEFQKTYPILSKGLRIIAWILLSLALVFSALIASHLTPSLPKEEEEVTAVILGSGVNHDGTVSLIGRTRIDAILEWLKDHPTAPIVVSGGNYSDALPSEAESMKNDLTAHGIAEERIYMEPGSINTRQNMEYTSVMIEEEQLPKTVLIATSEFHEYRTSFYAKRYGLTPYRMPGKTPWYLLPACWLRELYGILLAVVFAR